MACNSVATSKATIAQVALGKEDLMNLLAKTLGVSPDRIGFHNVPRGEQATAHSGKKYTMPDEYSHARFWHTIPGINTVTLVQRVDKDGEITLTISITGDNQSTVNAYRTEIQAAYDKQLIVATQSTVLRKLAQLGKLSKIEQKTNGVTARLEISI